MLKATNNTVGSAIVNLALGKFSKLLPIDKVAESSKAIAFNHPDAKPGKDILIIPKRRIKDLGSLKEQDYDYLLDAFKLIKKLVKHFKINNKDYNVVLSHDQNQINQLHFHLIAA